MATKWVFLESGVWQEVPVNDASKAFATVRRIVHPSHGDCHRWEALDYLRNGLMVSGGSEAASLQAAKGSAENALRELAETLLQVLPR